MKGEKKRSAWIISMADTWNLVREDLRARRYCYCLRDVVVRGEGSGSHVGVGVATVS